MRETCLYLCVRCLEGALEMYVEDQIKHVEVGYVCRQLSESMIMRCVVARWLLFDG